MLCFPEVFQQIMAGIKLTFKMQRTENEFDAERRIPKASGTRDIANLVPRVLSYPHYGERKLNYLGHRVWISFLIPVKLRVVMASYPLALSTELVSLRAAFTNSLWTSYIISASMKKYIYNQTVLIQTLI